MPVNQVSNLNYRVREAFIELFKDKPLERWMMQVHPDYAKQAEDVMINTLELDEVRDSWYIFS